MISQFDCLLVNGDSYSAADTRFPVYADHLSKILGVPLYNISVAGSSNDRILRSTIQKSHELLSSHQSPLVIVGWSFLHRIEIWYHGSNEAIISKSPDQMSEHSQLRFLTLDWIPDKEIDIETKKFLTSVDTIDKKITDWYLHMYLLADFFDSRNLRYLFFSAADNTDFPITNFSALNQFSFVKSVKENRKIYDLDNFCIPTWAEMHDPNRRALTGHLSNTGHEHFATFLMERLK